MLTRLIVYLAYYLKTSAKYQGTKAFFRYLLVDPESRAKTIFDVFMIALVIISVFSSIDEMGSPPQPWHLLFENGVFILFSGEYLLRLWIVNDNHAIIIENFERSEYLGIRFRPFFALRAIAAQKLAYILSLSALIDLLAILPSYRPLRFFRLLLIFRLLKLFRYITSFALFSQILANKRFELYTLAMFMGMVMFIGSTAVFLFENPSNGGNVHNLFEALYLTVATLSTVGYGDIVPQTPGGRLVAMVLIFAGLGVLSFFTSIILSAFSDKIEQQRENYVFSELRRLDSFVIICGFGRVGLQVARQLTLHNQPFVIIDKTERAVENARRLGYWVLYADASKNEVLLQAGINRNATAVLCTTGDDVSNVYVTLTSRQLNPDIRIISRVFRSENKRKLYQAGATHVIDPFEIAGLAAAEYVGQPVAFDAVVALMQEKAEFVLDTVCAHEDSLVVGKKIAEIDFEQYKLKLIGVVSSIDPQQKDNDSYALFDRHFYFNPKKHFSVHSGDLLAVLGKRISIEYFRCQIEKSRLKIGRSR